MKEADGKSTEGVLMESIEEIKAKMRLVEPIAPWEIVRVVGLLAANTLITRLPISDQWTKRENGAAGWT